jgi:hypothetical protein
VSFGLTKVSFTWLTSLLELRFGQLKIYKCRLIPPIIFHLLALQMHLQSIIATLAVASLCVVRSAPAATENSMKQTVSNFIEQEPLSATLVDQNSEVRLSQQIAEMQSEMMKQADAHHAVSEKRQNLQLAIQNIGL